MTRIHDILYCVVDGNIKYLPDIIVSQYSIEIEDFEIPEIGMFYTLARSGNKFISPLVEMLPTVTDDTGTHLTTGAMVTLAKIIWSKFGKNWTMLYNAFYEQEYNPIENYSMDETRTPNLTVTNTPNLSNNEQIAVRTDVETTVENTDKINGFNSATSVPRGDSRQTNRVVADEDKNITQRSISQTGTNTTVSTGTEKLTRSGNIGVTTSQQMLESEIELRKWDFLEKLMCDVDKIVALAIY